MQGVKAPSPRLKKPTAFIQNRQHALRMKIAGLWVADRLAAYHSPFTIHHSPFTVYHSPFTIHRLPFTVYHSPFTVYHSPFTVLPFTIHRLPFTIRYFLSSLCLRFAPSCLSSYSHNQCHPNTGKSQLSCPNGRKISGYTHVRMKSGVFDNSSSRK